jgi:hypothetical protein
MGFTPVYNVAPCEICDSPLSLVALREGVYWATKQHLGYWERLLYGDSFAEDRVVFAHRSCWKRISEQRWDFIRTVSDKRFKPRSLGAPA